MASPEKGFNARVQEIKNFSSDPYPRLPSNPESSLSCLEFRSQYAGLENEQTIEDTVVVHGRPLLFDFDSHILRPVGRIRTYRLAGSKLIFFDLVQDGHKIQVMCNHRQLDGVSPQEFKKFYRLLRRGDAFCMFPVWSSSHDRC